MHIKELMTKGVIIISADSTVKTAAEEMKKSDIGVLPVQEEGVLRGIITDRDIVVRCVAEGCDPGSTLASEIMTPRVYACHEDQYIEDVANMMKQQQIRRVVVLDRDDHPVGIVSLGDIAAHAAVKIAAEALQKVSAPVHSR